MKRADTTRRAVALTLLAGLLASLITVISASPAAATHFRFRDLTWRYDHAVAGGGNVVELTMRVADRRSYYGSLQVGSPITEYVSTGDGNTVALRGEVVTVNTVDDWFIAEVRGFHTYATGGPYTVSWESCCTLSTLRNSPDSNLRTTTVVDMRDGNRASPYSLVSPIVQLPSGGIQSFRIPATDADGHNVAFRLATQAESLVTQPTGLQIDNRTGVVTWDTTGRPIGLWMATVVMSDPAGASTMNTFLINLGGTASPAPTWAEPTPADRTNFTARPGDTFPLVLAAEDPEGQRVTITPLNSPPGFNCIDQQLDGQAVTSCAWRPEATGTHLVAFDAQDPTGASAGLRVYRLTAPRYVAFGDSYSSSEGALDHANYEPGTNVEGGTKCRRASTSYPALLGDDTELHDWTFHFVACSGARTYDFYDDQYDKDGIWQQEPQFDLADLGQDVELVTLTIGGNDAKFSTIIQECIAGFELLPFNTCHRDPEKTEHVVQDAFARLRGEPTRHDEGDPKTIPLATVYADILRQAPRARVIVLGYPQFFRTNGTFAMRCSGVHESDQRWVNEKVKEMNDLLREQATSRGLEFVYTSDAFDGHQLCEIGGGEEEEWFRDIVFSDKNASFHPDDDGHQAMYELLWNQLNNAPTGFTMTTGETREFVVDVANNLQEWLDLFVRWPGSDVEMTVTSPSGVVYDRIRFHDARHLLGPTFESFRIPDPEPGSWQLYGADLGADGEQVTFTSNVRAQWNYPPEARFLLNLDGHTLSLDASASSDPDGDALVGYTWYIQDETGTVAQLSGRTAQYTLPGDGTYSVTLRVEDAHGKGGYRGTSQPVTAGRRYTLQGPNAPLDPSVEWTAVQAGRTLPITWRLTEDDQPVSDPTSFTDLSSYRVDCDSGAYSADVIAGDTAGQSGLTYRTDGNWQYTWQTRPAWSETCRTVTVSFDDGSTMKTKLRFR